MAARVFRLKKQNTLNVVAGAADLIGATALISPLFSTNPSVETLNELDSNFARSATTSSTGARPICCGCKQTGVQTDPNKCRGASVGTPMPFEEAMFKRLSTNDLDRQTDAAGLRH